MCYVLDFAFMTQIKVCKFTEIPPTFQTINYLFFIEVDNANNYSILHNKKKPPVIRRLFRSSISFRSVAHVGNLTHQRGVQRLVGGGVVEQVAQDIAAGLLFLALSTENISNL